MGPEKQLGFECALKNMSFEDKNTAYKEWREKERQILKEICNCYGLETKTKEEERENNRGETYSTDVYTQAIIERAVADANFIIENAQKEASQILDDA